MSSAQSIPAAEREAESLGRWAGARLGVAVTAVEAIPAGIGLRRFYRLRLAGPPGSAIARIDAPEDPAGRPAGVAPEPPLEPVRAFLERGGLPVPRRYAADPARGIELLEDAGSESLCDFIAGAARAEGEALVARALDLVPRLQRLADDGSGVAAFGRRLDATLFRYKAELFAGKSLALALGRAPSAAETGAVLEAFDWIGRHCARAPQRFAHRDFQSHNLIVRRDARGEPALTLIDLQGAFLAPPEYDLVCLLRDSFLELAEPFVARERERIRPLLPDAPPADELALRFDLLTLTRKGKDHARFLTAIARGDARYRRFLPRTTAMLRGAAERTRGVAAPLARLAELVLALPEEPPCAR
jgi:aminoglycoside/choline kinase family phosphotransferase